MEVVYGATREGAFLTNHDLIGSIHLTGSTATYDAVVWGGQKKVRTILRLLVLSFPAEPVVSTSGLAKHTGHARQLIATAPWDTARQLGSMQAESMYTTQNTYDLEGEETPCSLQSRDCTLLQSLDRQACVGTALQLGGLCASVCRPRQLHLPHIPCFLYPA